MSRWCVLCNKLFTEGSWNEVYFDIRYWSRLEEACSKGEKYHKWFKIGEFEPILELVTSLKSKIYLLGAFGVKQLFGKQFLLYCIRHLGIFFKDTK